MTILREVKTHDSDTQANVTAVLDETTPAVSQQLHTLLETK